MSSTDWMDHYGPLLTASLLVGIVATGIYAGTRGDRSDSAHFNRVVGYGWCIAVMVIAAVVTIVRA